MRHHESRSGSPGPGGGPIRFETLAKPHGGVRVLTHLGPEDAWRYQIAVAAAVPLIEHRLTSAAVAHRAFPTSRGFRLEPWGTARSRYERAVRGAADGQASAAFVGDVADCYGSMTPAIVLTTLRHVGASEEVVDTLATLLRGFEARGVRGLPIGPEPSAVLANAVLAPVDEALGRAGCGPVSRWVDDVVVLTGGVRAAHRAARAFETAVEALGLAPAEDKCRVLDDPRRQLRRAATSGAPAGSPPP